MANINTTYKLSDLEILISSIFDETTETVWQSRVKYTENLQEDFRSEQLCYIVTDLVTVKLQDLTHLQVIQTSVTKKYLQSACSRITLKLKKMLQVTLFHDISVSPLLTSFRTTA
jgi:hypothetical protein